jgi:hypothetical protein
MMEVTDLYCIVNLIWMKYPYQIRMFILAKLPRFCFPVPRPTLNKYKLVYK